MQNIRIMDENKVSLEDKKEQNLREVFGKKGSLTKDQAETVKVYYDFDPCNIHDPVLLT